MTFSSEYREPLGRRSQINVKPYHLTRISVGTGSCVRVASEAWDRARQAILTPGISRESGKSVGPARFRVSASRPGPELTPRAMDVMRDRIPSPGAARFHPLAPDVPYAHLSNDPDYQCNPQGFPKLLIDAEPLEMVMLPDRIMQIYQWEHRIRYIWLDGRELPSGDNLDFLGTGLVWALGGPVGGETRWSSIPPVWTREHGWTVRATPST